MYMLVFRERNCPKCRTERMYSTDFFNQHKDEIKDKKEIYYDVAPNLFLYYNIDIVPTTIFIDDFERPVIRLDGLMTDEQYEDAFNELRERKNNVYRT